MSILCINCVFTKVSLIVLYICITNGVYKLGVLERSRSVYCMWVSEICNSKYE